MHMHVLVTLSLMQVLLSECEAQDIRQANSTNEGKVLLLSIIIATASAVLSVT
jgi:hypothetical protein